MALALRFCQRRVRSIFYPLNTPNEAKVWKTIAACFKHLSCIWRVSWVRLRILVRDAKFEPATYRRGDRSNQALREGQKISARCWVRTSDFLRVKQALYH